MILSEKRGVFMYHLAIDIGAASGRHIVSDGITETEVYRFANGAEMQDGHLIWNLERILTQVKAGIEAASAQFPLRSLSIDTWGVDYVLMRGDEAVAPCYAYRDNRTAEAIPAVHGRIPFESLYQRTGCQFQPFNTIYQLYDDLIRGRLEDVTDFLMIPEYLLYRLTGTKSKEFTNATTTGLVSAQTGEFDPEIIRKLGLPEALFPKLNQPGQLLGSYNGVDVVLCATHDTASAVEGIVPDEKSLYLSSGTWSLLGVRTQTPLTDRESLAANFSNEGGVGYNRYQKNIMGLWVVQCLQKELCPEKSFSRIVREAECSTFDALADIDDPGFLAPESMAALFRQIGAAEPADCFRCAFRSLARSYTETISQIERNTGKTYEKLYIVGGGAKNAFLNQLTADFSGKNVIALPIEATARGNINVQRSVYHDAI